MSNTHILYIEIIIIVLIVFFILLGCLLFSNTTFKNIWEDFVSYCFRRCCEREINNDV